MSTPEPKPATIPTVPRETEAPPNRYQELAERVVKENAGPPRSDVPFRERAPQTQTDNPLFPRGGPRRGEGEGGR